MTRSRALRPLLLCGIALTTVAVLTGCSGPSASAPTTAAQSPSAQDPSPSASSTGATPTATPAGDDYSALCAANSAAAAAKARTVGEDLEATTAQAEAIHALLPLQGVSAEIAAGAEVFAASAEEDVAILTTFPADDLVSDVGLDPKFTESKAVQSALTDPDYQAFIVWVIQTCGAS